MLAKLILEDGSQFEGTSFGATKSIAGEVVFSTGMAGYPESLTDPSYLGQILILTYPLIGNYGVPDKKYWESDGIKVSGLIVSNYIDTPSHFQSKQTLSDWLKEEKIPALEIKDTKFYDPNKENLVARVSTRKMIEKGSGEKKFLLIDCGAKGNIAKCLIKRGIRVVTVPWDFDPFDSKIKFDAIVISNGPGDPKMADKTIQTIRYAIGKKIPILGVCLGNQILALAAGGDTKKLKFGHRSQNQPCIMAGSKKPA